MVDLQYSQLIKGMKEREAHAAEAVDLLLATFGLDPNGVVLFPRWPQGSEQTLKDIQVWLQRHRELYCE